MRSNEPAPVSTLSLWKACFVVILIVLAVPVGAEECGTASSSAHTGSTTAAECSDPFGATTDESFSVVIDTIAVADEGEARIAGTTTALFSIDALPGYEHELFQKTEDGYEAVSTSALDSVPITPAVLAALVRQYFYDDETADIDLLTEALFEWEDWSTLPPSHQAGLEAIVAGMDPHFLLPSYSNIPVGQYVLVSTEQPICLSQSPALPWWARPFVQVAHACVSEEDLEVRTTSFTITHLPPAEEEVEEIDPLLLQYAPILQFHEDETYFPMDVTSFIAESALWEEGGTQLATAAELTPTRFSEEFSNNDSADTYLAYSAPESPGTLDLAAAAARYAGMRSAGRATSTVYVHKMNDTADDGTEYIVLQYWFFYAMNNWGEQSGDLRANDHEGDWESVFVYLDKNTQEPKYVAFSSHLNDGDIDLLKAQYDSVRREWTEDGIELVGDTVLNYVALGSHANYPTPGVHKIPLQADDITSLDGRRLDPGSLEYVEDMLGTDFLGLWGTETGKIGGNGPQGPQYIDVTGQVRFDEPLEWAGIDDIETATVSAESKEVTIAGIPFRLTSSSTDEIKLQVAPHKEVVSFGTLTSKVAGVAPQFWDIDIKKTPGSFEVQFDLPFSKEWLEKRKVGLGQLVGLYYDEAIDTWETASSTVNLAEGTVTITTDHFSRYAVGWTTDSSTFATSSATTTATTSPTNDSSAEEEGQGSMSTVRYPISSNSPEPQVAGISTSMEQVVSIEDLEKVTKQMAILVNQKDVLTIREREKLEEIIISLRQLVSLYGLYIKDARNSKSL